MHATDGTEIPKQLWKERNHEDNRKQDNVSAHRGRSRRRRRARLWALALWGCAPNATGATTDQKGDDKATEETTTSASVYPNFTEKAAGLFPDTYFNRDMLNTGNRGCNACHENLFDKMVNKEGLTHILSYVGYEKDGTYKDCEPCHQGHMTLTGPYLGDAIHASHYGNQQFVDANGNCWSCHAVNSDGEAGEYQFMLWEDFYEQAALGGYPWLADDETTRAWVESRGYAGGYPTEFSQEKSPNISATFAQDATDAKDLFIVNNWGPDAIDLEAVSARQQPAFHHGREQPAHFHGRRDPRHASDRVHRLPELRH